MEGSSLSSTTLSQILSKAVKGAGIRKKITIHTLRYPNLYKIQTFRK
jgi:site-specific recombinase XerD